MSNEGEAQSLSDRIREHLPEALRDDESLQNELARVEKRERAHTGLQAASDAARRLRGRAPRAPARGRRRTIYWTTRPR